MPPERELILCCVHTPLDDLTAERIREILGGPLSWSDVMANAIQHRVVPALYEGVAAAASDLISPSQQQLLREAALSSSASGMALARELLRLHQLSEAAQIPK
jgi:hypothetical protein